MTFSSTQTGSAVVGDRRKVWGTFTNAAGDTGGDITTGLGVVDTFSHEVKGSSSGSAISVNETFPLSGGVVTIVTSDGTVGYWEAWGKN